MGEIKMKPSFYEYIVHESPSAFVYFELVRDSNGKVIDGIYKDVNATYERLIGMKKQMLIGRKVSDLIEPDLFKTLKWLEIGAEVEKNQSREKMEYLSEVTHQFYQVDLFSFEKNHVAITYTESTTEILQKHLMQEDLKQTENQLSLILDSTEEAICGIDLEGKCTFINLSGLQLLRIKEESQVVGHQLFDYFTKEVQSTETSSVTDDVLNKLNENQKSHSDLTYFTRMDGTVFPIEYFVTPKISNGQLLGGILTFFDITKRKEKQNEISHLIFHDPLTGLYNRTKFEQLKEKYDSKNYMPLSVIMADVNGLRKINQQFGHHEGDQVLKAVTKIFTETLPENTCIARYGEDEFSILMPKCDSMGAFWYVKCIQEKVGKYNKQLNDKKLSINLALGYETKYEVDFDIQKVINKAEDYMDKQKILNQDSIKNILLTSIKSTLLARSQFTEEHAERLVSLSKNVGKVMKLSSYEIDELALLAELHDVGKIGIDDAILNKPGKLTDEEMSEMKKHSFIGYQLIKSIRGLDDIALPILYHHERLDGKGYPEGLTKYEIPLSSRIISVVDAYDAMTQDRPYRKAMSKEAAIEEIKRNSGTQFDPEIVEAFLKSLDDFPVE